MCTLTCAAWHQPRRFHCVPPLHVRLLYDLEPVYILGVYVHSATIYRIEPGELTLGDAAGFYTLPGLFLSRRELGYLCHGCAYILNRAVHTPVLCHSEHTLHIRVNESFCGDLCHL